MKLNNKWVRGALPALLIHCSIGSVYAWSMFVNPISQYMNIEQQKIQIAFSLAIFFLGMSSAVFGSFVEKNIKHSSLLSLLFFVSGLMVTSISIYCKSIVGLYVGYGVLMGIGLGIGYLTPIKNLMLWFNKNKGLGTGIAIMGFGFASTIASPMINFLTNNFTLYTTFILMGVIYSVPMFLAYLIIKRPEYYIETESQNDILVFKNSNFRKIWLIMFLNISCGLALISVASPMMKEFGISGKSVVLTIALMGTFNGLGRLIFSATADKLKNRKQIYYVIFLLSFVSCLLSVLLSHGIIISLLIVSACYGAGFSNLPSLLSDQFGMDRISKIHGLSLTAWAIAGLVGNQISSIVRLSTGSYEYLIFLLLTIYAIGVIITKSIK